jgi:uncharacterized protein
MKKQYSWQWVEEQINKIGDHLESIETPTFVTGVPRGGLIPAVILSHKFNIPFIGLETATLLPKTNKKKILLVDDISDSGKTLEELHKHGFITSTLATRDTTSYLPNVTGETIYDDTWLVFPWENINAKSIQDYLDN